MMQQSQNKSPTRQAEPQFIDLKMFPKISEKSRSFKELAEYLLK